MAFGEARGFMSMEIKTKIRRSRNVIADYFFKKKGSTSPSSEGSTNCCLHANLKLKLQYANLKWKLQYDFGFWTRGLMLVG